MVVVYKIDRLSRSLADFAKMVDVFDRCRVSFSAVTQQINSATSMGRLMLNVLLSFAQFEREVTGERIRDKIAASKKKGIWMGGTLPLGYDVQNWLLVVKEAEAAIVRRIFDDFLTVRSTTAMARTYCAEDLVTKTARPFTKQTLYKILRNRMYLGEINHKGQSYPGEHQAIVTQAQWDAVQALIDYYAPEVRRQRHGRPEPLLGGLLFTADGEKFTATFAEKNGRRYGYYTPSAQRRMGAWAKKHGALPIEAVETLVTEQIVAALQAPHIVQAVVDRLAVTRPDLDKPKVVLQLKLRQLADVWKALFPAERHRLVQPLIERVVMGADGMEIVWRDIGWQELAGELLPGTIGAELQEMEEKA